MKKNIFKNLIYICLFIVLSSAVLVIPAHADVFDSIYKNLGIFTTESGLPGGGGVDLPDIIVNIINIILGLLALVFIVLVIIGGFKYMTAGGNADKAKEAIKSIRDAAIGVAIIVLSGAVVNFILKDIVQSIF